MAADYTRYLQLPSIYRWPDMGYAGLNDPQPPVVLSAEDVRKIVREELVRAGLLCEVRE